ncbi:ethanolamine ammonia-lyase reactivating factor EutA [Halobacillus faecis]|uniref:Ethanolamine ammonia-lyase n=1 Tax=Halobacillus faecis TaxID=360184 RepID=A0A511WWB8_9BACI|nr:ethanolamine ammonia-lyase reactivating factor EutA [Halobacillus faecis]GEN54568.1 ethanolamine ammonia-lyase [Halobacillus faecis]
MNERNKEVIISAGIDIGTSTTKLVISRLSLRNTAGMTHMPRIEITDKEVIYESPIFRTPLLDGKEIDMEKVDAMVRDQYKKAGIQASDIQTGAVIITGETATKSNAKEMVSHLSDHAGKFLVATAGPDLESIIAAKGSGAFELSKKTNKTVANIDIGGGTANTAVYRYGKLVGTCTLHVGGKLMEFDHDSIHYLSPAVQKVNEKLGLNLTIGMQPHEKTISKLTNYMAEVIRKMLDGELDENEPLLLGNLPQWTRSIDVVMFSGGVSECIYHPEGCTSNHLYNDIGVSLAQSLLANPRLQLKEWEMPGETVRATVLGAGTQTTEISGATIQVDSTTLPLRDMPVHMIDFKEEFESVLSSMSDHIQSGSRVFDPHEEGMTMAIYLSDLPLLGFKDIQRLAQALVTAFDEHRPSQPLVIILERDLAKSLGQAIQVLEAEREMVCIDQIKVENGDYLDIGSKLDSGVVPVVIKTLTFHE